MLQPRRRLDLRAKSQRLFPAGELARENHFHRNDAVQLSLSSLEDDAHSTPRDFLQQFVVTKVANALRPLTLSLSPSDGERVARGREGGSFSEFVFCRDSETDAHVDQTAGTKPLRRVGGKLRPTFLACAFCGHDRLVVFSLHSDLNQPESNGQ